jgi:hypothetical protein
MSLKNLNNWFNLITGRGREAKGLKDNDVVAIGRPNSKSFNGFNSVGIRAKHLKDYLKNSGNGGGVSTFEALTDTTSYAGNALKLLRINALENAVEATDSLYENVFEFTLNDTPFLDKAIEYKLTLIFKRNGSTGTYGGLNLNGLAVRTSISYPTIGENVVNLINEAFIADPLDGLVVLYGNSSSLASGYEFVTPYPLGASLTLTTGNFSNPTPVGDTSNCTLYTKLEYNIIG